MQADRPALHPAAVAAAGPRSSLGIRCWKPGRDFDSRRSQDHFVEIRDRSVRP